MDKLTDKEINSCLETLKKLVNKENWFLIHEQKSIQEAINALESILHYPD